MADTVHGEKGDETSKKASASKQRDIERGLASKAEADEEEGGKAASNDHNNSNDDDGNNKSDSSTSDECCCLLRGNVVCSLFHVHLLELARASSGLFTKVMMPLAFILAAFGVGLSFSEGGIDGVVRSDALRIDPQSVLRGAGGLNTPVESCEDDWMLGLVTPAPGAAATVEGFYTTAPNLTSSSGAADVAAEDGVCSLPNLQFFESSAALVDAVTPNNATTTTTSSQNGTGRMLGGFVYLYEGDNNMSGPMEGLSPSWSDFGGVVHQSVGVVFNSSIVHSIPMLLNSYGRATLRAAVAAANGGGAGGWSEPPEIVVDIHPLP